MKSARGPLSSSVSSSFFPYKPIPSKAEGFKLTEKTFSDYVASLYPELEEGGEFRILGLRSDRSFYPLEVFIREPAAFNSGDFELIVSRRHRGNKGKPNSSFNPQVQVKSGPRYDSMSSKSNNPVEFWLSPEEPYKVSVSYDDVARLKRLSAAAYSVGTTPSDVYNSLNKVAVDGLVDDKQYGQFCNLILGRVEEEDQDFVGEMMQTLFTAFDRTGNSLVDLDELSSGFTLLTEGSKSDKLSLAFEVFDADDDGLLSRRELWKFLRAFLSVILEFSDAKRSAGSTSNLHEAVDDAAVGMVASIFKDLGVEMTAKISFEDFGEWYNSVGHTQMPWLELLDIKKWPSRDEDNRAANSLKDMEEKDDKLYDGDSDFMNESDASTTNSLSPIYEFDLGGATNLRICPRDVENLNSVLTLTNFHRMSGGDLQNAVRDASADGALTKSQFDSLIRGLKPGNELSKDEKDFLSFAFSSYFFAFDRQGENKVDSCDFANGFTLLAGGSKSDKLALAFQMLEQDDEGYIEKRELWQYLRSFLTMIAALTEQMSTAPSGKVAHIIHNACIRTTESIFSSGIPEYGDRISFEEFADWYTNEGYNIIPWIELLDLRKWPYETIVSLDKDQLGMESIDDDTGADDSSASVDFVVIPSIPFEKPVFQFDLNSRGDKLTFYPRHVENLRRFVRLSGFNDMDFDDIAFALKVDNADGTIDGDGFVAAISAATDLGDLSERDHAFVGDLLGNIYDSYTDDSNLASVNGLIAGLTVFTKGSKSEKLGQLFDLFCGSEEDEDAEKILFDELVSFFEGFLIVLACLSRLSDREDYIAELRDNVKVAATEVANAVFQQFTKGIKDGVSFTDIAEWYSDGGFQIAPFLELLDMKKWPGPTFEFALTRVGDTLCIFTQDIDYLGSILRLTSFDMYDAVTVCGGLEAVSKDGVVNKSGFDEFVRMLVPGNDLSTRDKQFLSYALSKIFFSFTKEDGSGQPVCPLDELCCGMLILAKGNKSDKLSVAFQTMGAGESTSLPKREMWRYLKSFLTALFALTNSTMAKDPAMDIGKILHNASVEVTEEMFVQAETENKDVMTFEEFADWYTYGGFEIVPWLELLDLRKWPNMLLESSAPVSPSSMEPKAEELEESEDVDSTNEGTSMPKVEQEPLLLFDLGPRDLKLKIYPRDVEKLQLILDLTGMDDMSCDTIQEAFQDDSEKGRPLINKSQFDRSIVSLVSGDDLRQEEKKFLSFALSSIFFAYASPETELADSVEVGSGFSLFASGSKSEKLALAFQLLDVDEEGYVDQPQLCRYLRSFLTALAALTDHMGTVPSGDALQAIEDACFSVTESIFQQANLTKDDRINFEEFADWYTEGGYEMIPWLELLDLNKWPYEEIEDLKYDAVESDMQVQDYDEDAEGDDEDIDSLNNNPSSADANSIPIVFEDGIDEDASRSDAGLSETNAKEPPMFEFVLNSDGDILTLSASDVESVRRLVRTTGLLERFFFDIQSCLKKQAVDGTVDRKGYVAALGDLLSLESLEAVDREFAIGMLVKIFNAYDEESKMVVPIDSLTAGLTVFVAGSKSQKLGYIFDVFCGEENSFLTQDGMFKFLRSLLAALGATSTAMSEQQPEAITSCYDQVSVELTQNIFRELKVKTPEVATGISFSDFADWYTDGGYRVAPWLELLDMKKWPGPSFDFTLTSEGDKLSVFPSDISGFKETMSISNLDKITAEQMQEKVESIGYTDGDIEQDDFDYIMRSLVPGDTLTAESKRFLSGFFSKYFLCMDEFYKFTMDDSSLSIPVKIFLVGMVLLSQGSKSSKLSFAFNLMSESVGRNGESMSFMELASFFGVLLLSLHSVTEAMKKAMDAHGLAKVMTGIENAGNVLAVTIYEQLEKSKEDNITFEEFADWYTYGGFEVSPWLELLDLKKWEN